MIGSLLRLFVISLHVKGGFGVLDPPHVRCLFASYVCRLMFPRVDRSATLLYMDASDLSERRLVVARA
jgi:hypothetical protein